MRRLNYNHLIIIKIKIIYSETRNERSGRLGYENTLPYFFAASDN